MNGPRFETARPDAVRHCLLHGEIVASRKCDLPAMIEYVCIAALTSACPSQVRHAGAIAARYTMPAIRDRVLKWGLDRGILSQRDCDRGHFAARLSVLVNMSANFTMDQGVNQVVSQQVLEI